MTIKEELTIKTLPEVMQKIRRQFPLKEIIISDRKTLHKHRVEQKTQPWNDNYIPGKTWIDGLKTYGSTYSGKMAARS